jgi:predicted transposase YdaD
VLFRKRINDISFTLDGKLIVLIESQSSINENMPLRLLLYISRVYEKIIDKRSIYHRALFRIPKPEFIVLYNGKESFPEQRQLRLSDAFENAETKELLELTVTVYNVNSGYNSEILERCEPLNDYTTFITRIRENEKNGIPFDDAVVESINYCIENGIMAGYLKTHGSEVVNMLFTEYNLEDDKQVSFEEGKAEGEAKAKMDAAHAMKAKGLSIADIAEITSLSIEDIQNL